MHYLIDPFIEPNQYVQTFLFQESEITKGRPSYTKQMLSSAHNTSPQIQSDAD